MSEEVRQARRPALPPLLYALAAVVFTERAQLEEGCVGVVSLTGKIALGVAVAVLALCIFLRPLLPLGVLVAASLVSAVILSSLCLARQESVSLALRSGPLSSWTFEVEEDAQESSQGFRCRAVARCEDMPSGSVWLVSDVAYDMGTWVRCTGRFQQLDDGDWSVSSRAQGICGTVRVAKVDETGVTLGPRALITVMRRAILDAINPQSTDSRALLAGCVCGWRRELKARGIQDLFSRCGASHLVAVSGGHLVILSGLIETMLRKARVRPACRATITAVATGMFVAMCGMPTSAVRAWSMTVAAVVGGLLGRRSHALSIVCAVGLVMALSEPTLSGRLSFVLSVSSVIGLCIFGAYMDYAISALMPKRVLPRRTPGKLTRRLRGVSSGLRRPVATSIVALLVTLPVVAKAFGEVSLAGPLTNVALSVPFFAMQACGMAAGAFAWLPPVRDACLACADTCADVVLWVLKSVDALPLPIVRVEGEALPLTCVVLLAALLIAWPRVSRRRIRMVVVGASCVAVLVGAQWRFFAPSRVCVLDVGQGDAILVQDGPYAVLVDAGPNKAVVDALARAHVMHLDAVIVTHMHEDHYAGMTQLAGRMECDRVIVARGVRGRMPSEAAEAVHGLVGDCVTEVAYGDVIHVGSFSMRVVSPTQEVCGDQNADSLMLLVTYRRDGKSLTALLTGDAEQTELASALARGDLCDIDVLKAGHHGSALSVTYEQACSLDPEVSVASAGKGNRFGHPRDECVEALEAAGSEFWCTKDVGDVELRPDAEGVTVSSQRTHSADV